MDEKTADFIKQSKAQGLTREQIGAKLNEAGWQEGQIEEVFGFTESRLSKKPRRAKVIWGATVVVLVFLIGGGVIVALYLNIWTPQWSPFKPSPQQIIAEMVENSKRIDFFKLDETVEWGYTDLVGEMFFRSTRSELVDESDDNLIKSSTTVSILSIFSGGKEVRNESVKDMELISIGQVFYFKEFSEWKEISYETNNNSSESILFGGLSDAKQSEELELFWGDPNLYSVQKEFFDEKLDGRDVYHYQLSLSSELISKVISHGGFVLFVDEASPHPSIEIDIWIDKESKLLSRSVEIVQFGINDKQSIGEIKTEVNFFYPEQLEQEIEAPKVYIDLVRDRDTKRIGDIRNAQLAMAIYFDQNNSQYPAAAVAGTCENAARALTVVGAGAAADPNSSWNYFYGTNTERTDYVLGSAIEGGADKVPGDDIHSNNDIDSSGGDATTAPFGCDCRDTGSTDTITGAPAGSAIYCLGAHRGT